MAQSLYLLADVDCTCSVPDMTHAISTTNCSSVVIQQSPRPRTDVSVGTHLVTFNVTDDKGTVLSCWANFTALPPASRICSSDDDGDGDTSSAAHDRLPSFLVAAAGLPLAAATTTNLNSTSSTFSSAGFAALSLLLFLFFFLWPGRTSAPLPSEA